MNKKTIVLLLLMVATTVSFAQNTIKGFVYDNDSGEPVPFANVVLKGTNYGVATDINGFFSINKIGENFFIWYKRFCGISASLFVSCYI